MIFSPLMNVVNMIPSRIPLHLIRKPKCRTQIEHKWTQKWAPKVCTKWAATISHSKDNFLYIHKALNKLNAHLGHESNWRGIRPLFSLVAPSGPCTPFNS